METETTYSPADLINRRMSAEIAGRVPAPIHRWLAEGRIHQAKNRAGAWFGRDEIIAVTAEMDAAGNKGKRKP